LSEFLPRIPPLYRKNNHSFSGNLKCLRRGIYISNRLENKNKIKLSRQGIFYVSGTAEFYGGIIVDFP
jgi:hypothetical protein